MGNSTNQKSADQIANLLTNMRATLSGPTGASYHLTQIELEALHDMDIELRAGIASAVQALSSYRDAVETKDAMRAGAIRTIGRIAAKIYNDPTITPGMILALGLEPRQSASRPAMPVTVTDLLLKPEVDGNCRITFKKGPNRATTMYDIQSSRDGLLWTTETTTLKGSERIAGCPPGVARWFRVVARNSVGVSAPSATASIYAPTVTLELKRAA